ncbi:hypothetical protein HYT92_03660 [Candidatus Pacearchaeota archaeon]|nr:hypothetical protein [Candidatus Pacearchaeota archaeon]
MDLAYRLGWFEPDFEFRGDKWFEGNREINKNIYEHIHENYGENMGNGNLITYSDGTARNIGVFDFRQTLVAKAYASDAFIVALEGDKASRDDAVQLLEQAESLQPKGAEAYYEIGRAYESIGKADRAQPFYQQAANAESDADKKNSYLSDVERVRGIQNDRKVYDWIDKAYKYYYDVPNNRREPPATRPRSAAPAQQEGELASAQTSSSQNAPQGKLQFMQASIIPGLSNVPWWAWLLFLGLPAILTLLRFLMRKAKRYKKVQDTKRRFSEEEQIRLQIDEIITRSNWAIAKLRRTIYIKALTKEGRDPAILFTKEGREKLLEEHQEIMDILDIEFKFYDRMKELSSIELELLEKVRGKK